MCSNITENNSGILPVWKAFLRRWPQSQRMKRNSHGKSAQVKRTISRGDGMCRGPEVGSWRGQCGWSKVGDGKPAWDGAEGEGRDQTTQVRKVMVKSLDFIFRAMEVCSSKKWLIREWCDLIYVFQTSLCWNENEPMSYITNFSLKS